jgi:hypothetical protein
LIFSAISRFASAATSGGVTFDTIEDSSWLSNRANHPEVRRRVRELTAEAREYSDIRIANAAVKLDHIASVQHRGFLRAGRPAQDNLVRSKN